MLNFVTNKMSALKMTGIGAAALMGASLMAPTAHAGEVSFGLTIHQPGYSIVVGNPNFRKGYRSSKVRYLKCSPHRAVRKARHIGMRHARIHRVTRKGVIVKGRLRGKRVMARLGRGCQVKGLRRI